MLLNLLELRKYTSNSPKKKNSQGHNTLGLIFQRFLNLSQSRLREDTIPPFFTESTFLLQVSQLYLSSIPNQALFFFHKTCSI